MSGYGGQPPSSWQGPYGQQPYGQDPYAQDPYGPQPSWHDSNAQQQYAQQQYAQYMQQQYAQSYGQGEQDVYGGMYGPPGIPRQTPSNGAAVAAIIGNCIGLVFICGIGIAWLPGLILGGMAVNKIRSDPESARALTRYSWICCGLNFVIEGLIFTMTYVMSH
jgi:hypothetical protein